MSPCEPHTNLPFCLGAFPVATAQGGGLAELRGQRLELQAAVEAGIARKDKGQEGTAQRRDILMEFPVDPCLKARLHVRARHRRQQSSPVLGLTAEWRPQGQAGLETQPEQRSF